MVGDAIASSLSLPFSELRRLPPNHLRIRIGVGNRILTNHVHFIEMGNGIWLDFLSNKYCTSTSNIVELGCGCGRIAWPLRGDWFRGTYVGVDIDAEMIDYCRGHFPHERFHFVLSPHMSKTYSSREVPSSSAARSPLAIAEAASKDFIFSISLYSHLLEDEFKEYLSQSENILKSGGLMYMTFFCIEHVSIGERWTFRHKIGNAYVENIDLPEAAVAYSESHVKKLVQDIGFENVRINPRRLQSVLVAQKR
jgi:SAM-dependent methyltransferase